MVEKLFVAYAVARLLDEALCNLAPVDDDSLVNLASCLNFGAVVYIVLVLTGIA